MEHFNNIIKEKILKRLRIDWSPNLFKIEFNDESIIPTVTVCPYLDDGTEDFQAYAERVAKCEEERFLKLIAWAEQKESRMEKLFA